MIGKLMVEHFDKIIGIDISVAQIEMAQQTNQYANIEYK